MSYKTEFASNNTDLQSILDAVNALPDAGSGAEVVMGSHTQASDNNSITIPALIGKENFSLLFLGSADGAVMTLTACQLNAETSEFYYGSYHYSMGYGYGTAIEGEGATVWDNSTGTLTRTTIPQRFPAGEWRYIGW